jgi:hypothetical protein
VGDSIRDEGGGGCIVRGAVLVTPEPVAVMVTLVGEATGFVVMENVPLLAPAAIVTLAGGDATAALLLESAIVTAPGAAATKVTVPVEGWPPTTVGGDNVRDAGGAEGSTVSVALPVLPIPLR